MVVAAGAGLVWVVKANKEEVWVAVAVVAAGFADACGDTCEVVAVVAAGTATVTVATVAHVLHDDLRNSVRHSRGLFVSAVHPPSSRGARNSAKPGLSWTSRPRPR